MQYLFDLSCLLAFLITTGAIGISISDGVGVTGRYAVLANPLLRALAWSSLSLFVYCAAAMTFRSSSIVALALLAPYGCYRFIASARHRSQALTLLRIALPFMLVLPLVVDRSSVLGDSRSLLFMDGTDQAGYAHMADWLAHHTALQRPVVSPESPYDSWPQLLLEVDPRFATFSLLAIVSSLLHVDALFVLDLCFCMVLLAVAGLVAESKVGLALALVGLSTGMWLDYTRSGYLGKVVGDPLLLLVVIAICILGFRIPRRAMPFLIAVLAMAATAHSGIGMAVTIAPIAALCFGLLVFSRGRPDLDAVQAAVGVWVAIMVTLVASTGILARPLPFPPNYRLPFSWLDIAAAMAEIADAGGQVVRLDGMLKIALLAVIALALSIAFAASVRSRQVFCIAVMSGTAILMTAYVVTDHRWAAYESAGIIRPLLVVALVRSFDDARRHSIGSSLAGMIPFAALVILSTTAIPRLWGAIDRYALHPPAWAVVSKSDIDRARAIVGPSRLEIDVQNPVVGLLGLLEFDRPGSNTQWSERGFQAIVSYRHWTWPRPAEKAEFFLVDTASLASGDRIVMNSSMFSLVRR